MPMTNAQLQVLKNAIIADPVLAAKPNNSDGAFDIATAMNLPASPTANVWRTDARVQAINDAINWSLYTPADTPDGTAVWTNRILSIQTKQMNLQLMLQGRDTVDASKANVRAGLRDAVMQVPAGANGALVSPGGASGVNVMNACIRPGLRIEILLKTSDVTTGGVTAAIMGYEGTISYQDVEAARSLP
jgi:hypothetical protein